MKFTRRGLLALAPALAAGAAAAETPLHRIAFGSCAAQDQPQPIWSSIIAARPDLFIFLGDNIYGDTEDMEVMRAKYALLAAQPGYQRLLRTCPVLATWDDHDYGLNDGGSDYPRRRESQQVFLDFFNEPANSPRRRREGIYSSYLFGPPERSVQVLLLDTRYHRSPLVRRPRSQRGSGPYTGNPDPAATILGPEQWKWLESELVKPAALRIIASSIQVVPEDHGWEKWMNFPHERERLFKLIRTSGAGGVLFISGDRHLAELSMMDGGAGYPFYDLTSSALNRSSQVWRPYEENRHRVGTMNWGDNFGLIDIDWSLRDPEIRLQIRDLEGEIAISRRIYLSTIRPAGTKH